MSDERRPQLLRRKEAAEYLKKTHNLDYSPRTLARWACQGGGPQFRRAGNRPLYPDTALDAWAARRLSPLVNSTSELAAEAA